MHKCLKNFRLTVEQLYLLSNEHYLKNLSSKIEIITETNDDNPKFEKAFNNVT